MLPLMYPYLIPLPPISYPYPLSHTLTPYPYPYPLSLPLPPIPTPTPTSYPLPYLSPYLLHPSYLPHPLTPTLVQLLRRLEEMYTLEVVHSDPPPLAQTGGPPVPDRFIYTPPTPNELKQRNSNNHAHPLSLSLPLSLPRTHAFLKLTSPLSLPSPVPYSLPPPLLPFSPLPPSLAYPSYSHPLSPFPLPLPHTLFLPCLHPFLLPLSHTPYRRRISCSSRKTVGGERDGTQPSQPTKEPR